VPIDVKPMNAPAPVLGPARSNMQGIELVDLQPGR